MTDTARELLDLGSSTLHEATGRRGWLGRTITGVWDGARAAGPCRTVWLPPGDNLGVHLALEKARPGEVLCVGSPGGAAYGVWGEVLMRAAQARGVVGVVTSAGIRDVEALRLAGFGAFGRGVAVAGTSKRAPGVHQVTITIGAGAVRPGDWVVADPDGVVVVAGGLLTSTVDAARRRVEVERVAMTRIDHGATSLSALGIHPEI